MDFFKPSEMFPADCQPGKAWCLWRDDCSSAIQMHFFKHIKATELSSQNWNNTFHWRKLLLESSYSLQLLLKWCKKIRVIHKLWIFVVVWTVRTGTGVGAGDPLGSRADHAGLRQAWSHGTSPRCVPAVPKHRNARTQMSSQLLDFKHNLVVITVSWTPHVVHGLRFSFAMYVYHWTVSKSQLIMHSEINWLHVRTSRREIPSF